VQALLRTRGHSCRLMAMQTVGDGIFDRPLAEAIGKGLFVKELEHTILEGRADPAVHGAKDVPFALAPALALSLPATGQGAPAIETEVVVPTCSYAFFGA